MFATQMAFRVAAGATPGAMPAYDSAGSLIAGTTLASTHNVTFTAIASGALLVLQILLRNDELNGALSSINTSGWTQFPGNPYGGSLKARQAVAWKISNGTESAVSVTCTGGTTNDLFLGRVYKFTAANGFHATPIEAISTLRTGSDSLPLGPAVTPLGTNRLGCSLLAFDANDTTIDPFTGESGGDWTEAIQGNTTSGGGGSIQLQTADLSGGGAISGGSMAAVAGVDWSVLGFALRPADL